MNMQASPRRIRRTALLILIALFGLGSGAFLVAWSGVYNVAASSGHWSIVEAVLRFGMRNSVDLRAGGIDQPDLNNRDLIVLGAGHFERGCAFCHGSPDKPGRPVAAAMLPVPPSLSTPLRHWTDQELFWIVRHGIKYTGMPAWPALERSDEVWALVAFLKRLPSLDADSYRNLAFGAAGEPAQGAVDRGLQQVRSCAGCHGGRDTAPSSGLVPRLHGQRERFLANALRQYASGARPSGIMKVIAAELDAREIDVLAKYYAELQPFAASPPTDDDTLLARGRMLATEGDAARRIPACASCHGRQAHETFPLLDGQSAAYLAGQLRLWKVGINTATEGAAVMAPIARRLSEHDIDALARYFAGNAAPEAAERRP